MHRPTISVSHSIFVVEDRNSLWVEILTISECCCITHTSYYLCLIVYDFCRKNLEILNSNGEKVRENCTKFVRLHSDEFTEILMDRNGIVNSLIRWTEWISEVFVHGQREDSLWQRCKSVFRGPQNSWPRSLTLWARRRKECEYQKGKLKWNIRNKEK